MLCSGYYKHHYRTFVDFVLTCSACVDDCFSGYMSPEYAMHGQFSVKSDMYSFGVLVLEIISGKKNSSFYQTDGADDLVSYVSVKFSTTFVVIYVALNIESSERLYHLFFFYHSETLFLPYP